MKLKNTIFILPAFVLAMTACSDENNNGPESIDDQKLVYMDLALDNCATIGSRADGDAEASVLGAGVEVGQSAENAIKTVNLFLFDESNKLIANATSSKGYLSTEEGSTANNKYNFFFKESSLKDYAGKNVTVMVYCNNPQTDYNADLIMKKNSWGEGKAGDFMMSNADTNFTFTVPEDITKYNSITNPYTLGTINVERASARFDIANSGTANDNKFAMSDGTITLILTDVAMINISNDWYAYRRVAAAGTDDNRTPLTTSIFLGAETANNYIVDADWTNKKSDSTTAPSMSCLMNEPKTWSWTSISSITEGTADNDAGWTNPAPGRNFFIWRYANENTIPGIAEQIHKNTTGVVFKAKLTATTEADANNLLPGNNTPVYVYLNKFYGTWEKVKEAAKTDLGLGFVVAEVETDGSIDPKKAAAAGFTQYKPDKDGNYYCYYYYWNRHNDNANNIVMGQMEFAVVRNNVYKLYVDTVLLYGHPDPEDPEPVDPDPVDPDDPDESATVYLNVKLQVMPWVVRVNKIEF